MFSFNKILLGILLSSTGLSYAGTMGPICQSGEVKTPCEQKGWQLAGRALYLQTSASPNFGAYSFVQNTSAFNYNVNPNWNWGFQLEAAYDYHTGNDLNLNWYHYQNSNSSALSAPLSFQNVHVLQNDYQTINVTQNTANTNNKWDQVNMELGKTIDVGDIDQFRVHGGFNFSRVSKSAVINVHTIGTDSVINMIDRQNSYDYASTYNGFGPRLGLDLNHKVYSGIRVYADGAATLLAGHNNASFVYNEIAKGYGAGTFQTNNYLNQSVVVPELDAKVGVNYQHTLSQGLLTLDVGWLWANYFQSFNIQSTVISGNDNFGIQGLYFGLKWNGHLV
jgi:hypothetical protein